MIHAHEQDVPRPSFFGGGAWSLRNLNDVTVLVGKNGSGKSILLRAWRDLNADGVHYIAPERTGEVSFQPSYLPDEMAGSGRRGYSTRNYVDEYRRRVFARVQAYLMRRGNVRGGALPPGDPSEVERLLSALAADFTVRLLDSNPPYELRRLATNEVISNVEQLSSGEAQMLTLGMDVLTIAAMWEVEARQPRVILIDEPDVHIHPDLQARFADFLLQTATRFSVQFVVATHSTSLLSALGQFGGDRTSVVFLDRARTECVARVFDRIAKELAACLGGHVLMGPLFGAPLLLVEGDDDYRIWAQVPRHHVTNIAVIPANGDEIRRYQAVLEQIFSSLSTPSVRPVGFALLDGDKKLPTANPQAPQQFVRYIRLECREAENLYLSAEVLASLGESWDTAAQKLVAAAAAISDARRRDILGAAQSWDRANVDIKLVIDQIAKTLDPKQLPWTLTLGRVIGRSRPVGELASFLGRHVVEALWYADAA